MQDNDSGKQCLFSRGKIFQKGWFVSKENDPLKKKKCIYLSHTQLALLQFSEALEVDC